MSTVPFLLKGLGIGLALAAPVGPMSILCIRRTLRDGPLFGIVSGLGIASADAAYGAVAAFYDPVGSQVRIGQHPVRMCHTPTQHLLRILQH